MRAYKKICLILFIILIASTVSAIHASDDFNCTSSNDGGKLTESNNSKDNLSGDGISHSGIYQFKSNITIEESEDIPIKINSPISGELRVRIDDKYDYYSDFQGDTLINIPTYNEFYYEFHFDEDMINLKEGTHNISFYLHLNTSKWYYAEISTNNSILTFNIVPDELHQNIFKYETSFNMVKKNKTVHILEVGSASIRYWCLFECDNDGKEFLIALSKDGHIIDYNYKSSNKELIGVSYEFKSNGVYNLTVVNLKDGTNDTALLTIYDDLKFVNCTHVVKDNNITFLLEMETEYTTTIETCVIDYMGAVLQSKAKEIQANNNNHKYYLEFTYSNLKPDNYTIWYFDTNNRNKDYHFFHFEIRNQTNAKYSISKNESMADLPINKTLENNETLQNNASANHAGNNSYFNLAKSNGNSHHQNHGKNQKISRDDEISNFGDMKKSGSEDADFSKSYELSPSVSKSIKNMFTAIGLLIIFIISILIGYFKFKKNMLS